MKKHNFNRVLAGLVASGAIAFSCPVSAAEPLDLGSSAASMPAAAAGVNQTTGIRVGNNVRLIHANDSLTPAEFVAVRQVLTTGTQSLLVNSAGRAIGGNFLVNSIPPGVLAGLTVPTGVTAINNFTNSANLQFLQNLVNNGNFYAVSTNVASNLASISAENIVNTSSGLLTSVLPPGGVIGFSNAINNLGLSLTASGTLTNAGTISSAGVLNVTAGDTITNSGLITSVASDVNLSNSGGGNLIVRNGGGTISAPNGTINVGTAGNTTNVALLGGDWLSRSLNVAAYNKAIVDVGQLRGVVNVSANELHVTAATDNLQLGDVCLKGDPTFYNTAGSITLTSSFNLTTNGAPLAIIAHDDIVTGGLTPVVIDTSSLTGGGDVNIIAGVEFSSIDGPFQTDPFGGGGDTTSTIEITGFNPNGGNIDLTQGPGLAYIDTRAKGGDSNAGSVNIQAYGGPDGTKGRVLLPTDSWIKTGGSGTGSDGFVAVTAGYNGDRFNPFDLGLQVGDIDATGSAAPDATGSIILQTNDLTITDPVVFKNGEVTSTALIGGGDVRRSNALIGDITASSTAFRVYLNLSEQVTIRDILIKDDGPSAIFGRFVTTELNGSRIFVRDITTPGILDVDTPQVNLGETSFNASGPIEAGAVSITVLGNVDLTGVTSTVGDINVIGGLDIKNTGVTSAAGSIVMSGRGVLLQQGAATVSGTTKITTGLIGIDIVGVLVTNSAELTSSEHGVRLDTAIFTDTTVVSKIEGLTDITANLISGNVSIQGQSLGSVANPIHFSDGSVVKAVGTFNVNLVGDGDLTLLAGSRAGSSEFVKFNVSTENNGDLILKGDPAGATPAPLFGGALTSKAAVNLTADGSGSIIQEGRSILSGGKVTLTTDTGNIGVGNVINGVDEGLWVRTTDLTVKTNSGNVLLAEKVDSGVTGVGNTKLSVDTSGGPGGSSFTYKSGYGSHLQLATNIGVGLGGTIDIQGGNITQQGDLTTAGGGSISLWAQGGITQAAGKFAGAEEVLLNASDGDIGTASMPFNVKNALDLTVNDANSAVIRTNNVAGAPLTLHQINAFDFNLDATNQAVTVSNVVNAGSFVVNSGGDGIDVQAPLKASQLVQLSTPNGAVRVNETVKNDNTTGDIVIKAALLENNGELLAGNHLIVGTVAGSDLELSGNSGNVSTKGIFRGQDIRVGATPSSVASQSAVTFKSGSHLRFEGPLTLVANADAPSSAPLESVVEIEPGASVFSDKPITLFSVSNLVQNGSLTTPQIKWITPRGLGTIASTLGDVVLTSNIKMQGHHLTVISAGNIIAGPSFTSIDLSHPAGFGGSVNLIAGYDFTESSPGTVGPKPVGGSRPAKFGNLYTIGSPSEFGGSVIMPKTSITTSSPTSAPETGIAGDVTVVAHSGTQNAGVILLGGIKATGSATNGRGGDVTLIGQGGVQLTSIDATAAYPGNIEIHGAEPTVVGGPIVYQDGYNRTSATWAPNSPSEGAGAAVIVTGKINADGKKQYGGNINVTSDSRITLNNLSSLGLLKGGNVAIASLGGDIKTGSIDVSALAPAANTHAGHGGTINISGPGFTDVGILKANGAAATGISDGGRGGVISLVSTKVIDFGTLTTDDDYKGGIIEFDYATANGGNGFYGGDGGFIGMDAGSVRGISKTGAYTISAAPGLKLKLNSGSDGLAGAVTVSTYAVQSFPTNFDLKSTVQSETALPGGLLTVGTKTANGTAGGITTGAHALTAKIGYRDGSEPNPSTILLGVNGAGQVIKIQDGAGFTNHLGSKTIRPGDLVTPAEAVAVFQVSHTNLSDSQTMLVDDSGIGLNYNPAGVATGGSNIGVEPAVINVHQTDIMSPFTAFVIPGTTAGAGITFNVSGQRPIIDLSASTKGSVQGEVVFTTPNSVNTIQLGAKPSPFTANSEVRTAASSTLVLSTTGTTFNNTTHMNFGNLVLLAGGASLTFDNQNDMRGINGAVSRVIIPAEGLAATLTIKNNQNIFQQETAAHLPLPISYEKFQLPLAYGVVGQRTLPTTAARNVSLTVALQGKSGVTPTAETATVGGDLVGNTVTVKTIVNPGTAKNPTHLKLQPDTFIMATTGAIKVESIGTLDIGDRTNMQANDSTLNVTAQGDITVGGMTSLRSSGFAVLESKNGNFTDLAMDTNYLSFNSSFSITAEKNIFLYPSYSPFLPNCFGFHILSRSGDINLAGTILNANGSLDATAPKGSITSSAYLQSGLFAFGVTDSGIGTLAKEDVLTKGSIAFVAGNTKLATTDVTHGNVTLYGGRLNAIGGNVSLNAYGSVKVNDPSLIAADGGNVTIFARGPINGDKLIPSTPDSTIRARAIGTDKASTGGGIEITSGANTSTALSAALASKTPTPADADLTPIGSSGGDITRTGNGGVLKITNAVGNIDLTNLGGSAEIVQVGGAIVLQTKAAASAVQFNGVKLETYGFKPLAVNGVTVDEPTDYVVDTDEEDLMEATAAASK